MSQIGEPDAAVTAQRPASRQPRLAGAGTSSGTERLRAELEELGLSSYEARLLLALLRVGSASPGELARVASVPRTSSYQVLEELQRKGLAERLAGQGPAVWASRQPDELLARLDAAQEERLRQHKVRTARVREMMEQAFPERPTPALPFVHVIHDPSQVRPVYEGLLQAADLELLVFNRPPYSWSPGKKPNPVVVETAARVSTRALYQAPEVEDPGSELWLRELEAYHAAGVEGRIVEEVPIKLAVVDRKVALLALDDPVLAHVGFPITLLVEHPGFAAVQAEAFDHRWESARPYLPGAGRRTQSPRTERRSSARSR